MSTGGAQGVVFGPFLQDIPRFKKGDTERGVTNAVDPDLIWTRKNRLVEGFYEVTGRLRVTEASGAANGIAWEWDIPDAANAIVNINVAQYDVFNAVNLPPADWSGDGGARYSTIFPAGNEIISAILHGVIFVPTPGDVVMTWNATDAPATVLAGTMIRLHLMR